MSTGNYLRDIHVRTHIVLFFLFCFACMIDPSAAEFRRRRQPETSGTAASQILVGAPARQPKFTGAAAAVFFSARRGASELNSICKS